jgi:hypothetical protein
MTFIETIPEEDAQEAVAELYGTDRAAFGHVPNFTRAFSLCKVLDAVGTTPDAKYADLDDGLREALVVGRAIA